MLRPHLGVPFLDGLSNNAPAIFVTPGIINASLSEFARNYGHLASLDDLHLHSFSCGDESVVRCSSPPFCGIVVLSHGLLLTGGDAKNVWGRWRGKEGVSLLCFRAPAVPLQRDNACEALAKWILLSCDISAHQCNLVCDLVTAQVRDLFIQVHWGYRGKSPC